MSILYSLIWGTFMKIPPCAFARAASPSVLARWYRCHPRLLSFIEETEQRGELYSNVKKFDSGRIRTCAGRAYQISSLTP